MNAVQAGHVTGRCVTGGDGNIVEDLESFYLVNHGVKRSFVTLFLSSVRDVPVKIRKA